MINSVAARILRLPGSGQKSFWSQRLNHAYGWWISYIHSSLCTHKNQTLGLHVCLPCLKLRTVPEYYENKLQKEFSSGLICSFS